MVLNRRLPELVALLATASCGWLPADKATTPTPEAPAPVDPDAEANQTWLVEGHVMVKGASVEEADAIGFHGRTVVVAGTSFLSPWQGTCENMARAKTERALAGVVDELAVEPTDRPRLFAYGLGERVREYRLTCTDRGRPPPLLLYVGGGKAMTCFGGACYLMTPFEK